MMYIVIPVEYVIEDLQDIVKYGENGDYEILLTEDQKAACDHAAQNAKDLKQDIKVFKLVESHYFKAFRDVKTSR